MAIHQSIRELIGNTPLVQLNRYAAKRGLGANILAKIEYFNPAGSVKDRVGFAMLDAAEKAGKLNSETVIIEPTSGNTGIGLAAAAAARGLRIILTMPETMSVERRNLLKAYGAELVLTETHFKTTGPEIWRDTEGKVDIFVAGVGTGGTISGVGKYLKSQNPNIKVVAVEPDTSAVISGEPAGPHKLQGIVAGFIPDTLNTKVIDEIMKINTEEAYEAGKALPREEGFLVGISAGAALAAATKLAKLPENKGKNIVVVLPDSGDRYLSSEMFA